MPPDLLKFVSSLSDFSKVKSLSRRTDIIYRDNAGFNLTIDNLPWGQEKFTLKRYRIRKMQNLDLAEEKSEAGAKLNIYPPRWRLTLN